jgi:hypothetical protein
MKRNPRWMVLGVLVLAMVLARDASSEGGRPGAMQYLPSDPVTIGDPDGSGGGKNLRAPLGNYVVMPLAGSVWTLRITLPIRLVRSLLTHASSASGRNVSAHD